MIFNDFIKMLITDTFARVSQFPYQLGSAFSYKEVSNEAHKSSATLLGKFCFDSNDVASDNYQYLVDLTAYHLYNIYHTK